MKFDRSSEYEASDNRQSQHKVKYHLHPETSIQCAAAPKSIGFTKPFTYHRRVSLEEYTKYES